MTEANAQANLEDKLYLQDNLQLGFVEVVDGFSVDPGLANYLATHRGFLPQRQNAEAVRLWAHHFSDSNYGQPSVKIPVEWNNFFTSLLLSPTHFSWAKNFLLSKAWDFFPSANGSVVFSIPQQCPNDSNLLCHNEQQLPVDNKGKGIIEDMTPPFSPITWPTMTEGETSAVKKRKKQKKEDILVDTSVRRSLRMNKIKKGFKPNSCVDKNCVACDSEPPALSPSVIKNLGETFCKIDADKLTKAPGLLGQIEAI
ncbi:hypothetical protein C2845_PM17G07400 [Panicum miliaceum]|uniref:Uncharacterized protein n=1 Tax=Panicum miliaceum TaxID=4540 RepID=A0A3L6Q0E2_PANMI|nr:hypothetical protein C2845_PM17G07400 [Panicum miliaceum]